MHSEIDLSPSKVLKRLADKITSNENENDMKLTPYKYSYKLLHTFFILKHFITYKYNNLSYNFASSVTINYN